ncbi:MAG: DUF2247 family protein [Rhodospirillaceae bacterium]|nr:DUF2247 family protein [Rhodospirillales bacterium]
MMEFMLSARFLLENANVDWGDLVWAYERQLISWKDLVEIAQQKVGLRKASLLEVKLSNVGKDNSWSAFDIASKLIRGPISEEFIKKKWLYLCLLYVYRLNVSNGEKLSFVESIYAEFDYPDEISGFIRYIPPAPDDAYDPSLHSIEENERHLFKKMTNFLNS